MLEQRYKLLADYSYDWEYWKGPDGRFLWISPACERISGHPPDDWNQLLAEARAEGQRLQQFAAGIAP